MNEMNINQPVLEETLKQKEERFIDGCLTEEEIREHWSNPETPLFEHEIIKKENSHESRTRFRVRALSEKLKDDLLTEVKGSWGEEDFESLENTLNKFLKQKKLPHPTLSTVEYYLATDVQDKPFAITGIYTNDMMGAGFTTRDKLNLDEHNLVARLGWFSVSKKYQGTGIGGFLFDWIEKMAKSRGAKLMAIETDDSENEETALKLYASRGYKQGLDIKDYFGSGRDLNTYHLKVSENDRKFTPQEKLADDNKEELLALAEKIYSPGRFEEFRAWLDLFLQQKEEEETILKPHSIILRDSAGQIEAFSLIVIGIYENLVMSEWQGVDFERSGSKEKLVEALKDFTSFKEREILTILQEGEDRDLLNLGFQSGKNGIPEVFEKEDPTKFLLYSKKL